jgi:hypothetical protein
VDRSGLYLNPESDIGQLLYGDAVYRVQKATVDANRRVQSANNEKAAADSELQRFSAELGNRRRMDAAGQQIANIQSNIVRNEDAKANGDIQQQLALAEELGSHATMAAAAGVGGSSVDTYEHTVNLRAAMNRQEEDNSFAADLYGANKSKGDTMYDAVAGLDNNNYRATLDYRKWVDPHKQSTLSKIAEVGLTAAATYFGGPQAGQAVMGVFDAHQEASNGDYASASKSMEGAIENGVSAYQDTRSMGGSTFWSKSKPSSAPAINVTNPDRYSNYDFWSSSRNQFNPSNYGASFKI